MKRLSSARDIMVTKVITLTPETDTLQGIKRLLQANVTGAPVVGPNHKYLGVFSEKGCMNALLGNERFTRAAAGPNTRVRARDIMATHLVTLSPEMDCFDAISLLLRRRVSGAPVVDSGGRYGGVFSEKTSMSVLLGAAYDQLPGCQVGAFMDTDPHRTIDEDVDLLTLARIFLDTHYRRLPVLRGERVVGQVSRRDVLRAALMSLGNMTGEEGAEKIGTCVAEVMDTAARTIPPDIDLLSMASIFRETPYRRLPVVEGDDLLGLVSRRDLLQATVNLVFSSPKREKTLLYLSALENRDATAWM